MPTDTKDVRMTPAKGMLMYALYYYESDGESSSLFVANKLAYLFKILGAESFSQFNFSAEFYGPYCHNVDHVVYALNGRYIRGFEQMRSKPFDPLFLDYGHLREISKYVRSLSPDNIRLVARLTKFITGFQSALSLEVLATVAWLRFESPKRTKEDVIQAIEKWSDRKKALFKPEYIDLAWARIDESRIFG